MTQDIRFRIGLAFTVAFIVSCSWTATKDSPRTYYETLDLTTPETALRVFVNAFQQEDFSTVFLVLSPNTQFRFQNDINLLNYGNWMKDDQAQVIMDVFPAIPDFEHFENSYFFDLIMQEAKRRDALLIDLSGKVTILDSHVIKLSNAPEREETATQILATVEGLDGTVEFRMVQAPSGRWRVRQVLLPGGDEEKIPWGIKTNQE